MYIIRDNSNMFFKINQFQDCHRTFKKSITRKEIPSDENVKIVLIMSSFEELSIIHFSSLLLYHFHTNHFAIKSLILSVELI